MVLNTTKIKAYSFLFSQTLIVKQVCSFKIILSVLLIFYFYFKQEKKIIYKDELKLFRKEFNLKKGVFIF
jgi:hypothetical protein